MIYRVVLDNVEDIHTQDNPLLNPSLELEMNSAGSFKFTLPPMHPAWDEVKVLKTTVDIFEGEDLIFTGRVANIDKNWNNERVVECEGALAFFNDSVQRQMKWENPIKISEFLTDILNNHNTQVPDNRKIYLGNVTITDSYVTREVDYEMTLDILTRMCVDTNGGWFMIRKDLSDNKLYLDWFEDFTNESDQPVQFGLNLLDFSSGIHAEDICTGVLAKGATVNDQVVMLNNVELVDEETYPDLPVSHYTDRDQDILWHREGVETYGKVLQVKEFSDAQTDWKDGQGQIVENSLFELAKKWLVEKNTKVETIEVEAAELAWLGSGYPTFQLGTLVELNDSPHISESIKLPMYKISLSLDDGAKKITLGTPPKKELTQISASNSDSNTLSTGSSSSGSGGGGGGTECLVQDVWVNGASVVSGKIARVTVPTDTVTTSQMNTAINTAVAPKANTTDVNNALSLKANTIDVTNALALKADKTEIIDVEANPSETATDDLTTIKIGDTVYDIPGGGGSALSDYYSTEERVVGRWVDGKPLYQKTVYLQNVTINKDSYTSFTLSDHFSNVENAISYDATDDLGRINPLINANSSYKLYDVCVTVETNSDKFTFSRGNSNNITRSFYFTLRYTKTTDTPGTGPTPGNLIYLPALYSEEEREVGIWTDGKPLYQKTIDCGALPNKTSKEISSGLTNENVVNWFGYSLRPSDGIMLHLPYCVSQIPSSNTGQVAVNYSNDAHKIFIYTSIDRSAFTETKITLQYTKTTDQPGSGKYLPDGQYAHHYSTSEKIVGTWIDGSTIYERTWDFGSTIAISRNGTDTPINDSSISKIIDVKGMTVNGTKVQFEVSPPGTASNYVRLVALPEWDTEVRYLTLQYTKSS